MINVCRRWDTTGDRRDSRRPSRAPGARIPLSVFLAFVFLLFSGLPGRAQANPSRNLDQTLNKVFDPSNFALRVNAVATGGGSGQTGTFLDADQIFNKIFDPSTTAIKINCVVGCSSTSSAQGTVTSVGFSLPSIFQVTGSPVTTSGTITATWNSQAANLVLASPNGAAGSPLFRSLVDADLTPSYSGIGSCPSNQWVTGLSRNGAPTCFQPAFSSIGGVIAASQLPTATASTPGAIQLTGDLGGSAASPKVTWLQGYPLSATPPSSGQCLVYTSSWGPGSCGSGSGTGLPSSWSTNSTNNAVTVQPMAGQDAVPLTVAPNIASPTADLLDICSTSPCSSGTKYVWVTANGNLNFLGNNITYGTTGQSSQSFLRLYGATASANLAPPYLDLEKEDASVKSYLAPSTTLSGVVGISSVIPSNDIQAPAGAFAGTVSGGSGSGSVIVIANSAAGTANGLLAKLTGSGTTPTATTAGTSDTAVPVYPVATGGGTSANAALSVGGVAQCAFDGGTTLGHFVQASTTVAGDCHDAGATSPTSGWVIGQVLSTNAAGGTYNVQVGPPGYSAASGGSSGLADPGSNGIVKRTALNATAIATYNDVVGLFNSCSGSQYLGADGNCHSAGGSGTVTSVGLSMPSVFTVNGSPVTASGTLNVAYNVAGADYALTSTGANSVAWGQINSGSSCGDSSHALSYSTATHLFGCQLIVASGGGSTVNVSGATLAGTTGNFNGTTPAAQSGYKNITWQTDSGSPTTNISAEVPIAVSGTAGVVAPRQALTTDSSGNLDFNPEDASIRYFHEDWPVSVTSGTAGVYQWHCATISSGGSVSGVSAGLPNAAGAQITTAATSGNGYYCGMGNSGGNYWAGNLGTNINWSFTAIMLPSAVGASSGDYRFGASSGFGSAGGVPSMGIYARLATGALGDTTWHLCVAVGSVETCAPTATTGSSSTPVKVRIYSNSTYSSAPVVAIQIGSNVGTATNDATVCLAGGGCTQNVTAFPNSSQYLTPFFNALADSSSAVSFTSYFFAGKEWGLSR